MSQELTQSALNASEQLGIEPQIVLEFDEYSKRFGSATIKKVIQYGDTGLTFGAGYTYGGLIALAEQNDLISLDGTTSRIRQQLEPDRGAVSSVSSMTIRLVDEADEITELISPGVVLADILGQKCTVYLGFNGTSFPTDYIRIFRGIVDDVVSGAGWVDFTLAHPDQKKRAEIFPKVSTTLSGAINDSVTTIPLDSTANFITPVGSDTVVDYLIQVNDEIIKYTGISGSSLTGCTRGFLGTTATSHDSGDDVNTLYQIQDDAINLALKIMMSGGDEFFKDDLEVSNFQIIDSTETVDNAIFFQGIDITKQYGIIAGDFIETTGASLGANNITKSTILDVVFDDRGSYVVVADSLEDEFDTSAIAKLSSQFNVLSDGLAMDPTEVDVAEHDFIRRTFLSAFEYRFVTEDTLNGKEFIEKELYSPASLYAVPKKGKSSLSLHIGPIPTQKIPILSRDSIKNPDKLKIRRTINRNFYNSVVYKFDRRIGEDKYDSGVISINSTSLSRIKVGNRPLTIESKGLRRDLTAVTNATIAANRRLDRYKFGAEFLDGVEILFKTGFNLDVGDIVLVDFNQLKVSETADGTREKDEKFFEVINRSYDYKTGNIVINLTDTSFDDANRYGLISPSSFIKSGLSTTQFIIEESYASKYGPNEFRKWSDYIGASVLVRSDDFATTDTGIIKSISGNTITLESPLSFLPPSGYVMELSEYDDQTAAESERVKLIYVFMQDNATFADGEDQYLML